MAERVFQEIPEKNEGHRFGLSVGVRLTIPRSRGSLVLVQLRDETWGLPAGKVKPSESFQDALVREVGEETGIDRGKIYFNGGIIFTNKRKVYSKQTPEVMCVLTPNKTSIGLIYEAVYHGPRLPKDGWEVFGDNQIIKAKPFTIKELIQLTGEHLDEINTTNQGLFYRPEFNYHVILDWIVKNASTYGKRIKFIDEWLTKNESRIPGLLKSDNSMGWWFYDTGSKVIQDKEAIKRAFGLKWGE